MVALVGGDNSVDLIVAAQAVHYFDLQPFYNIAKRVLRKEGGLIAVWVYNDLVISPEVDAIMKRLVDSTFPYRTPVMNLAFDGYKTMPFPFESIGMGSEGKPIQLDIPHKLSLKGFVGFLRSWQPAMKAKERGVELVTEDLINQFEDAWGDDDDVKDIFYKAHMIVGKLSVNWFIHHFGNIHSMFCSSSNDWFVIPNAQSADIERHRKRFESNCVVTKLKDSNNSAVIASGLWLYIFNINYFQIKPLQSDLTKLSCVVFVNL